MRSICTGAARCSGSSSPAGLARATRHPRRPPAASILPARAFPPENVLLEETGTTTWESLRQAAAIARKNRIGAVMLVSDPFHMLRSLKMAHDLGLVAYGSPTRTSPISGNTAEETRYVFREAWAYLVYLFAGQ